VASTFCHHCATTTVRLAGQLCAKCQAKGFLPVNHVDAPVTPTEEAMSEAEPRAILERQLRQAAVMQQRVQDVMDNPRMLLCVSCQENPRAVEQVDVAYVLDQHVKSGKVLAGVIPVWQKLQKDAVEAAEQMGREEIIALFEGEFGRWPTAVQREVIQMLTRKYNESQAMRPNERSGNG
jgi:hypothetical protein